MDWSRRFDNPIVLPDGRSITTLKQAGRAVVRLPESPEAHLAAGELLKAAKWGGSLFMTSSRNTVNQLFYGKPPPVVFDPDRVPKQHRWKNARQKLKRDR